MKLILYLFLMFPIATMGQSNGGYLPIISSDHSWIYSFGILATNEYRERYTYSMDSIWQNDSWYHERLASLFEDGSLPRVEGWYREQEGKLYKKTDVAAEEQVVVDMTLQESDTISIKGFSSVPFTFQVAEADTIILSDGVPRKRLFLTCEDEPLGHRREWIEGIGDAQFESDYECPFSWSNVLRCYSDTDGPIYANEDFQPCWLISSTNNTKATGLLSLMPNPAWEQLHITTTDSEFASYHIIDMSGRLLQTGQVDDSQIDISQLSPGLYVIELTTTEGRIAMSKFVKE